MNKFDYIIAGAGCAGLSFLTRLLQTGQLDDAIYDKELQHYILGILHLKEFSIIKKEFGIIPMTNYPFRAADEMKIIRVLPKRVFLQAAIKQLF